MFGVVLHAFMPVAEINALLRDAIDPEEFREARRLLDEIREPAARRRSILRDPDKHLAAVLQRWYDP